MKRHGGDHRGSAASRRARKHWMLSSFGDGVSCRCTHCGKSLDYNTVEADRIVPGGPYRRENVQPACRRCNLARSDDRDWSFANTMLTVRPLTFAV
jgi:5-methylcytosine-specific restriction endonuclease McrA